MRIPATLARMVAGTLRIRHLAALAAIGLILACIPGTLEAVRAEREAILQDGLARMELVASLVSMEMARLAGAEPAGAVHLAAAVRRLPAGAAGPSAGLFLFDADGRLLAAEPPGRAAPPLPASVFAEPSPGRTADGPSAASTVLADGEAALAVIRRTGARHLVVLQPLADLRPFGFGTLLHHRHLALGCLVALASLGALGLWQARCARGVARDAVRLRRRIDASLVRGRCGLWDWDIPRGRIVWSRSMYELLGYEGRDGHLSFGEVNGIIHPADGDLYVLAERIAASAASHVEHEFRARSASGAWVWLRARAEVVTDPDDGSRHLVGVAVDISEERGFVERSAENDIRLRDAIEALSEAFVLWDAENRLVLCNSKFRALHDLPAERFAPGATYAEIIEAGRPAIVDCRIDQDTDAGTGSRTLEAQLSDGRWLQVNERRTREGGFVSVGTDITALKLNEEKLLDSERQLLGTVSDLRASRRALETRTQQLAEVAELYHEQKGEAETASRAKSEFLAKMSHELRTPLNAIIGFGEVIQGELYGPLGDARYRDYAGHIRASGHDLLSVINDILQISRIEAGYASLSAEPVELDPAVGRALAGVRAAAAAKSITIFSDVAADSVVEADERALGQILANLLQNAVKFTPAGGTIRVRARLAGPSLNLYVADSGIGIARDVLPRLGRPFEQAETEASRAQGGSGLGLAIVRALTRMHGGTLRIRSEQGIGTVVLVHLPLSGPPSQVETPDRPSAELDLRSAA